SMAELLKRTQSSVTTLKKGDIVEGVITKLNSHEILVDINAKAEALVLEKEKRILNNLLSTLAVGDKVTVQILNPESDMGYPVVSLRRFLDDAQWKKLDELKSKKEVIEVTIDEVTKGGFLVTSADGMSGFLPNSHISFRGDHQSLLGTQVKVVVFELDRGARRVVLSQKHTTTSADFEKEVQSLKAGAKIKATVSNTAPFGVFVTISLEGGKMAEGFIHISEVAWENVQDLSGLYKAGDSLEAEVIGIDKEARRVNLSLKRLKEDPFEKLTEAYPVDKKVTGVVGSINPAGVVVELEGGVSGLIKKDKVPPTVTFKPGDNVNATVSGIDKRTRRVLLTPVL
ncbi:MAG: S1 RNA-binding domain-containing protein, partial [Candidatus Levyibacteriota bacterium]